jgi:WD40 repeat protein
MSRIIRKARSAQALVSPAPWLWSAQLADHVSKVSISPDGKLVAAGSLAGDVSVFAMATGEVVSKLGHHSMGTLDLAWSPSGHRLATAGQDGRVVVWDTESELRLGEVAERSWAQRVRWSHSGDRLVAAIGKRVVLLDEQGSTVGWFGNQASTVSDVVWSQDERRVGVLAYGGVRWFGTGSPKSTPDSVFAWKGSPLRAEMSPSGRYLAHGNQDNSIHLWLMGSKGELEMGGYPAKVDVLKWNRNGDWLAAGTIGATTVWDCSGKGPNGRRALMCEGHDRRVTATEWLHSSDVLISGSSDMTLRWYRPRTTDGDASPALAVYECGAEISCVAVEPDDSSLVVGMADGSIGAVATTDCVGRER